MPPRATRAIHCPRPECNGRILGTIPRDAHGTFYMYCRHCGTWVATVVRVEYIREEGKR